MVINSFCGPNGGGKQGAGQMPPPVTMGFGLGKRIFLLTKGFVDQTGPFWQWFALHEPEKVIETTHVRFSNEKQLFLTHTGVVIKGFEAHMGVVNRDGSRVTPPSNHAFLIGKTVYFERTRGFDDQTGQVWQWFPLVQQ